MDAGALSRFVVEIAPYVNSSAIIWVGGPWLRVSQVPTLKLIALSLEAKQLRMCLLLSKRAGVPRQK